ncbi:MAG: hypothetical protein O2960_05915 [Verrucomicrobia bacterium]|nr:hypothetical protein [Verrucomicrobiota bacterium]
MNASFTDTEARNFIGSGVETLTNLPQVPLGTRGRVVDARCSPSHGWVVRVEWALPRKHSAIFAQVGEFSLNIPWRSRVPTGEFDKGQFESCMRPVES